MYYQQLESGPLCSSTHLRKDSSFTKTLPNSTCFRLAWEFSCTRTCLFHLLLHSLELIFDGCVFRFISINRSCSWKRLSCFYNLPFLVIFYLCNILTALKELAKSEGSKYCERYHRKSILYKRMSPSPPFKRCRRLLKSTR